jgi:hypothetical protein
MQHVSIQLIESLSSEGSVFEFNEAHRTVLLGSETKSLVATLFRKDGFQLVFRSVHGQIADVESVARRVLVGGIHRRISRSGEMLRVLLIAAVWCAAQSRRDGVWRHCGQSGAR